MNVFLSFSNFHFTFYLLPAKLISWFQSPVHKSWWRAQVDPTTRLFCVHQIFYSMICTFTMHQSQWYFNWFALPMPHDQSWKTTRSSYEENSWNFNCIFILNTFKCCAVISFPIDVLVNLVRQNPTGRNLLVKSSFLLILIIVKFLQNQIMDSKMQ